MFAVFDALHRNARSHPDVIAFVDDDRTVTWAELEARVADLAARLEATTGTIAIGLAGGIDYVVADLAASFAGRRQVPLPFFFSKEQNAHILVDAAVRTVITNTPDLFEPLPHLQIVSPKGHEASKTLDTYAGGAERVIYTSGSSGTPKGVVIGDRQLSASVAALSAVVQPTPADVHLSVLPLAQLLEQICSVFLPIIGGARTVFRFEATKALFGAPITPLIDAFDTQAPTTSLLAPSLLGRWSTALHAQRNRAPGTLRFVAVGGAATAPALIAEAEAAGIPVREGYGLSECCAVVAMNHPGDSVPGTVGHVLDGLDVTLEEGEIVVSGPTVMQGYLNGTQAPDRWHTGDMGHFENGRLVVDGRKDALLVTGAGRNVSPEWVEQRINADPRVVASVLGLREADGELVLIVAAAAAFDPAEIGPLLADLPGYARPVAVLVTTPTEPDLLFPAGTPNRAVAAHIINSRPAVALQGAEERMAS